MNTVKKIIATIVFFAALVVGIAMLATGCKSIEFERVDGDKIVRGSYYAYGIENNLEGLEIIASPTNGVMVRINRSSMDMSEKHEKIIDASGKTAGMAVGAAVSAAVK